MNWMRRYRTQLLFCLWITPTLMFWGWARPAAAQEEVDPACLDCHAQGEIENLTDAERLACMDQVPLRESVHGDLDCVDCHSGAEQLDAEGHMVAPPKVQCEMCHDSAASNLSEHDIHGKAYREGNDNAPYCSDCHGGHSVTYLDRPQSPLSPINQPKTCGKCHGGFASTDPSIAKRNLVTRYQASIHWQGIQQGLAAASCTDCHGSHHILPSVDPASSVSRTGIITTCQNCHRREGMAYLGGRHAGALLHGNLDVPTCVNCHGDHDMTSLRSRKGEAYNYAGLQVCVDCHGNERMMSRYALDTTPVDTYFKDFHGLTQRGSFGTSATCADCHDSHHSLPTDDPRSKMHVSNRVDACGECHGEVNQNFAMSFTHKKAVDRAGGDIQGIVRLIYILLIFGTIGGMALHNLIIIRWVIRRRREAQAKERAVRRMNGFEIASHFILFITFALLAITGFALKYPDAHWVTWLFRMGLTETLRALIHRTCAVIMTIDFVLFGIYMLTNPRGREITRQFMPKWADAKQASATMSYYLGHTDKRPRYGIFNYAEKAEFWALVWGTLIMALTGLFLWFPKMVPETWPAWMLDVMRTVHFYEAVLATLAIIVWHGFHVMFHPAEYPMQTSWLTGYLTREEAKHHFNDEAIDYMLTERGRRNGNGNGHDSDEHQTEPKPDEPPPDDDRPHAGT